MNTNMTGFRWFSKNLCILYMLWMKVASALEGLSVENLEAIARRDVYLLKGHMANKLAISVENSGEIIIAAYLFVRPHGKQVSHKC